MYMYIMSIMIGNEGDPIPSFPKKSTITGQQDNGKINYVTVTVTLAVFVCCLIFSSNFISLKSANNSTVLTFKGPHGLKKAMGV